MHDIVNYRGKYFLVVWNKEFDEVKLSVLPTPSIASGGGDSMQVGQSYIFFSPISRTQLRL